MTVLHLGVIEQPYADSKDASTTGDVANILEKKYHVMEHFFQLHQGVIVKALEDSVLGSFESMMSGAPPAADVHAGGAQKIEETFRRFLSNRELDALGYPGIPTKAAQRGVNHRFKRPRRARGPRPSFIDTGLYETSFRAWVTD